MKRFKSGSIPSLGLLLFVVGLSGASAFAVDWSPCKKEIEKFCKRAKGKSDAKMFECLSEHDEHHDNALSEKCDGAHSQYEKENGIVDEKEGEKK